MAKKVVMLGSFHGAYFMYGKRLPKGGETVTGDSYFLSCGGKGSNQAVACAILGGDVTLIQKLGNDDFGIKAKEDFKAYNLNTDFVTLDDNESTGFVVIMIDEKGENAIMCVPGAHSHYTKEDIDAAEDEIRKACLVGFVLETNHDVVAYGLEKAWKMGVPTLLDPAPAAKLPEELYRYITYIKPNEHEASELTGIDVHDEASAIEAGKWFLERGVRYAIITLGGGGCVLVTEEGTDYFKTPKVDVVDTTGAGDNFTGGLIYALSSGMDLKRSVQFGICTGSLSVTKKGVWESSPSLMEVEKLLNENF